MTTKKERPIPGRAYWVKDKSDRWRLAKCGFNYGSLAFKIIDEKDFLLLEKCANWMEIVKPWDVFDGTDIS